MYFISEKISGYNPQSRFKYLPVGDRKKILFQIGRYIGMQHRDIQFESHGQFRVYESDNSLYINKEEWTDVVQEIAETFLKDIEWEEYEELISVARQTVKKILI